MEFIGLVDRVAAGNHGEGGVKDDSDSGLRN